MLPTTPPPTFEAADGLLIRVQDGRCIVAKRDSSRVVDALNAGDLARLAADFLREAGYEPREGGHYFCPRELADRVVFADDPHIAPLLDAYRALAALPSVAIRRRRDALLHISTALQMLGVPGDVPAAIVRPTALESHTMALDWLPYGAARRARVALTATITAAFTALPAGALDLEVTHDDRPVIRRTWQLGPQSREQLNHNAGALLNEALPDVLAYANRVKLGVASLQALRDALNVPAARELE